MKKTIYYLLLLIGVISASCSSDEPVGPGGITGFDDVYNYNIRDTVISADSHEFTLSMTGDNQPKDWKLFEFKVYEDKDIPDTINEFDINWRDPEKEDYFFEGNIFGVDWIKFEKQITTTSPELKISVEKNTSTKARGVMLVFGNENGVRVKCGHIFIIQKPMPDMSPFTMKIRYKGNLYSTSAQLNINEEIEYNDSEFSRIMDEIDGLKNIEAVIMEDDIVDYFDMSDVKMSKAVSSLSHIIDSAAICSLRMDLPFTRANDAYRYEDTQALGYFAMYDDSGFSDTQVHGNLYNLYEVLDEDYMRNIGLNDKVSSLAVSYKGMNPEICAVLTIWEDSYYNNGDNDRTKHRISIIATKNNPKVSISKLKSVKCINSHNSWNDRISSYSFAFGNYDSHLKDY